MFGFGWDDLGDGARWVGGQFDVETDIRLSSDLPTRGRVRGGNTGFSLDFNRGDNTVLYLIGGAIVLALILK